MTAASYTTIAGPVSAEHEVKRSRFLCELRPVADEAAARAVVAEARAQHWDARHHVSAFVLGADAQVQRSSDDGEPSGTAGAPVLEVLRGRELTEVVAVVSRWFGGTLLGAGGLVRAYGRATRLAVEAATVRHRELVLLGHVEVDHGQAGRVENELRQRGLTVRGTDYAARASVRVGVRPDDVDRAHDWVAAATGGQSALLLEGQDWVEVR